MATEQLIYEIEKTQFKLREANTRLLLLECNMQELRRTLEEIIPLVPETYASVYQTMLEALEPSAGVELASIVKAAMKLKAIGVKDLPCDLGPFDKALNELFHAVDSYVSKKH